MNQDLDSLGLAHVIGMLALGAVVIPLLAFRHWREKRKAQARASWASMVLFKVEDERIR